MVYTSAFAPAKLVAPTSDERHADEDARSDDDDAPRRIALLGPAVLTVAAVALVEFLAWQLTRPSTADESYERIAESVDRGEVSQTAKGDIDRFLKSFPDDSRA